MMENNCISPSSFEQWFLLQMEPSNGVGDEESPLEAQRSQVHVFNMTWETLPENERQFYFAFLLFAPMQKIDENWLQQLWNLDNVEKVRSICLQWRKMSLVQRHIHSRAHFFTVDQICYKSAFKRAYQSKNKTKITPTMFRQNLRISAFVKAASEGHCLIVKVFLEEIGVNVDGICNETGNTALMAAFHNDRQNVIDVLLGIGKANIESTDQMGRTVLMKAAQIGRDSMVEFFLWKKAKIDVSDINGDTALMIGAYNGHLNVVQLLLREANVNQVGENGKTALIRAAESPEQSLGMIDLLADFGANLNAIDSEGRTGLLLAAAIGQEDSVEVLIKRGANVNLVDKNGNTALMMAAEKGYVKIVRLIIASDAKVNFEARDRLSGSTALLKAAANGHDNVVCLLLMNEANVDAICENDGETALIKAIRCSSDKTVRALIAKGADVNVKVGNDGGAIKPALCLAAENGNVEVFERLVLAGAMVAKKVAKTVTFTKMMAAMKLRQKEEERRQLELLEHKLNNADCSENK